MVDLGSNSCAIERPRNRFRNRLNAKSIGPSPLSNIPETNSRNTFGIGDLNQRITDLKMEPGTMKPSGTDLQTMKLLNAQSFAQPNIRRDSNNSTNSSSYHSMRSADFSRRSSQNSQLSTISTIQQRQPIYNTNTPSFYDPISPGSSRRSSQLSTVHGGQSLPPPPSSHMLSSHLQRLQNVQGGSRHSFSSIGGNNSGFGGGGGLDDSRRFSEPVLRKPPTPPTKNFHPNQAVVLDEVEENEMVENKLDVLPDDMLRYLYGNSAEVATNDKEPIAGPSTCNNMDANFNAMPPQQQSIQSAQQSMNYCDNQYNQMPPPVAPAHAMNAQAMNQMQQQYNRNSNASNNARNMQQYGGGGGSNNSYYGHQYNPSFNMNVSTMNNAQQFNNNNGWRQNQTQTQQPQECNSIACHKLMGYFHRTDQSAHNCCLVRMMQMSLSLNDRPQSRQQNYCCNQSQPTPTPTPAAPTPSTPIIPAQPQEIQCTDISQSQLSPARMQANLPASQPSAVPQTNSTLPVQAISSQPPSSIPPPPPQENSNDASDMTRQNDTYQRTLEYVQNCQYWIESTTNATNDAVSSSTHPSPNMVVNDLSTSLNSYLEEDRYLQMIQP